MFPTRSLSKKIAIGFSKSKQVASFVMKEAGANLIAVNLYPLGLLARRELAEPHPHYALNPRPVLLVHGVIHNSSAFFNLRRQMAASEWKNIFTINYSTAHGSLTSMVEQLAKKVEEICTATNSSQIDIVAHSLGGIVSRYYMCVGDGRGRVGHLITLGTPHQGTGLSVLLKGLVRGGLDSDLRSGSYLINLLKDTSIPRSAKLTSIYSKFDWIIWPQSNCYVEGLPRHSFTNHQIDETGHMGLLFSTKVSEIVMKALLR